MGKILCKITKTRVGHSVSYKAGSVVSLDADVAKRAFMNKWAEPVSSDEAVADIEPINYPKSELEKTVDALAEKFAGDLTGLKAFAKELGLVPKGRQNIESLSRLVAWHVTKPTD